MIDLGLQIVALGLERGLIDRAGKVGVEQPALHARQFAAPFGERRLLAALVAHQVSQCGFECGTSVPMVFRLQPNVLESWSS